MFKDYKIVLKSSAKEQKIKDFILRNHYLGSLSRGNKYVFELWINNKLKGVSIFGVPTGKDSPADLECKRFCLAPKMPKNSSSWFMAKCLKQIKQDGKYDSVVSYADPEKGHVGTIYKASNYTYLGEQKKKGQAIKFMGENFHLRCAYQKIDGTYTKTAQNIQYALQNGTAKYISLAKKHIYKYDLKK
jgi:hypothetical protein